MARGLNLHARVRKAMNRIHPDETIQLYRSNGNSTDSRGISHPTYRPPLTLKANIQSPRDSMNSRNNQLRNSHNTADTQTQYLFYLTAETGTADKADGINRTLGRGGDLIRRADGTWYLITSVEEDFANVGWQSVIGTLQTKGIDESQITAE